MVQKLQKNYQHRTKQHRIKQRRIKERRQRPLYKCMVKTAITCLLQNPKSTRQQIERKVTNIYKKQGLDHAKHKKSIKRAVAGLIKTCSLKKREPHYQIVSACTRCIMLL